MSIVLKRRQFAGEIKSISFGGINQGAPRWKKKKEAARQPPFAFNTVTSFAFPLTYTSAMVTNFRA
jgi:hypothetical protein